LSTRTLQK